MMQTRPASLRDLPWLLEQLWAFDAFCGTKYSMIPFEDGEATALLARLIGETFFRIAEENEQPVGFICGVLQPHYLNSKIMTFTELFWWVVPEKRNTRAGALLFMEFTDFGKRHANWIVVNLEYESPVHGESLLKRDFRLKERTFLLEV